MSKREPGLYVIFDGPPGPESGRFIEVEDENGRSIGPWDHGADWTREDWIGQLPTWRLGPFPRLDPNPGPGKCSLCRHHHDGLHAALKGDSFA